MKRLERPPKKTSKRPDCHKAGGNYLQGGGRKVVGGGVVGLTNLQQGEGRFGKIRGAAGASKRDWGQR